MLKVFVNIDIEIESGLYYVRSMCYDYNNEKKKLNY